MHSENKILFLQKQIESLEQEKLQALEALELASSLGTFETSYSQQENVAIIMAEICRRANLMMEFANSGVYLFDEETNDFAVAHYDRPEQAGQLDAELEALIADYAFSYAMQVERCCFYLARDKATWVLLHVLATPARIRGMFAGVLVRDKNAIPDTTLSLFTVVMLAGAHALESFELNKKFREHREELESIIAARTESLHETNRQLETIVNNIHAGVMLVDPQSHEILDLNPAALRMLGARKEEILGRVCHQFVCPAQADCCPVTDLGQVVDNSERVLLDSSGAEVHILKTVTKIQMNGRDCLLEVFMDLSEQKKLENLKADIERMTRHDLKTPLNGIIGLPDIILDSVPPDEEVREMLHAIKESGLKMLRMINMSLDLYKMETGTYAYRPVCMNVMPVLRSVIGELEPYTKASEKRISLTVDGMAANAATRFSLHAEELLLYSLLGNLLKNAVEASGTGATIMVELTGGAVPGLRIRNPGEIPESIRQILFKKYATSKKDGTGLGLYSARLIARTMGGGITLEPSEPGVVCFALAFPPVAERGFGPQPVSA